MKAWDIYSFQPQNWPQPHPAVIVSHSERVANKPEVTILMCSSKPAARPAKPNEVILDASDGLQWPTLCKCDLLYTVPKSELKNHRGAVTPERRKQIITAINRSNGWVYPPPRSTGLRDHENGDDGKARQSPARHSGLADDGPHGLSRHSLRRRK